MSILAYFFSMRKLKLAVFQPQLTKIDKALDPRLELYCGNRTPPRLLFGKEEEFPLFYKERVRVSSIFYHFSGDHP